jgi:hypothetical protein
VIDGRLLPTGSSSFDSGLSGLAARPGDHICGLYSGDAQRDDIMIPFLEASLSEGDKCICVVDGSDPTAVVAMLGYGPPDAVDKQLEVIAASDMYLRSGAFKADEVIGAWKAAIADAMYDGRFDVVRAVETWSRRDVVPDTGELLVLESEMNRYLPLYPQVVLCLYDIERFGAGIITNLLRTHPRMLVGNMLVENPYYLSPDELLAQSTEGEAIGALAGINEAAKWYFDETTGST